MSTVLGREILKHLGQKVELSGLNPAARAFLIADLLINAGRRIAVICPSSDDAARMHQDVRAFLTLLGRPDLATGFDLFPGWELSPYRAFSPSINDRIYRLRTLQHIRTGKLCGLVTDIRAIAQRCPSIADIEARTFTLKTGDMITHEQLSTRLEVAGYNRNDPVEDPGNFTSRGSLFDIFSPAHRRPYRLDFFGDELETIRTYDPVSQRSDPEAVPGAVIIPVTEWTFSPESVAAAKREIKAFCDDFGLSKRARDLFFDGLDAGVRDSSLDYLAPFFCKSDRSWLPAFFDDSWSIALDDTLGIESSYDALLGELKLGFEQAIASSRIVAPWERLYVSREALSGFIEDKTALQLNAVLLGVPEGPAIGAVDTQGAENCWTGKFRVDLVQNSDLKPAEHGKVAFETLRSKARKWAEQKYIRLFVASTTSQAERMRFLLDQHEIACRLVDTIDWKDTMAVQVTEGQISSGFRLPDERLAIVTDSELFGPKKLRPQTKKASEQSGFASFIPTLEDLNTDELIVHSLHGIGRYRGLVKLEVDRVLQDFLLIEYADGDKLYLPVYRLDQVQRYIGAQGSVSLDKLGSSHFEKTKEKVKGELQELARQLLQLYAKRASREGFAFSPPDASYQEFEAKFPYAETPDQLKAIEDVANDMSSSKIMDRLVCGDVGYGKTEVAMRAAFRTVMDGKQVAVLVPTTVLALQHERSFRGRFEDVSGINIGVLSRFKSPKEIRQVIEGLKSGAIDIVIGTHRLLSRDITFKDLGLLVVDEEQRFGVEHKERLKNLKVNTDVLTLTATPIPRTLQFSLMGLRDISIINTAPVDRLSVRTYVARFDEDVISKAIRQELARGGQVFFIHNRVKSISAVADQLHSIVPEARVIVAHGQLDERELESRMLDFYGGKGNVLLCSTIIESGLDIPSANTMIINRADTFGLAQLYQLRGRVGRSQARAYCYLLLPEEGAVTDDAKKRLDVIQRFVDLGSGFKIASHDLELRGGGDVIGKNQSGHIAAVGFELYSELLDESVRELRGQPIEDHFDPEIKLPVPALLPDVYIPDVHQRLGHYKRLSQAVDADALHRIELELQDRYGKPTTEVQNLLWLIHIKQLLRKYHIKSLVAGRERTAIDAGDGAKLSPDKALSLIRREPKLYTITPDSKIIIKRPFESAQRLFHEVRELLTQVAEQQGAC